jgi:hypothetical protein
MRSEDFVCVVVMKSSATQTVGAGQLPSVLPWPVNKAPA